MIKKIEKKFLWIAIIQFIISFWTDHFIFNIEKIHNVNYVFVKLLFLICLVFLWQFIANVYNKKEREQDYFKYFMLYIIPMMILLLIVWPGFYFGGDVQNLTEYSMSGKFLYHLNYLTSIFYMLGYMFFPCTSGPIILQTVLFGIVFSYIIKNIMDIYKSKIAFLMVTPFFLLHTIHYTFYANRPVMFGMCYLLLFSILVLDAIKKNKLTKRKLSFLIFLTGIVSFWRNESIYLILLIPIFLFFVYKEKCTVKRAVQRIALFILVFLLIALPQAIGKWTGEAENSGKRNLPIFISPLSYMLTSSLEGENIEKDLAKIDKVLNIEEMKKYPSYVDTPCMWEGTGCVKSYNEKEYKEFIIAYINVIKNNWRLYLKTKIKTFTSAAALKGDYFSSIDLYNNNQDMLFERKDTKTIVDYKIRRKLYRIIEGKTTNHIRLNEIIQITGSLWIPLLFIFLIFIFSIIKKNIIFFLLSGCLIMHTVLLFFIAPAAYFMYHFNVYMTGWFLGLLCIINQISRIKYRNYNTIK